MKKAGELSKVLGDDLAPASRVDTALGASLKALRKRKGWSLAVAAEKTGSAMSTLSRVENGQISPTYESLLKVCRGFEIDLSELLVARQTAPPESRAAARRSFSLPNAGRSVMAGPYDYRYVCTEITQRKMHPIIITTTATRFEDVGELIHHSGEEFVYVLSGTLLLHTEFYEPLEIPTGGSVYFDASMGHVFLGVEGPATFISVSCEPVSETHRKPALLASPAHQPPLANKA